MAIIIPTAWSNTAAYSVGDRVDFNGVGYECVTAVAANSNGNTSPVANSAWTVFAVFRITDYYSLQESIEQAINTDDDEITNSIPLYIQNAERKVGKLLRSPAQKITRNFTVQEGSYISIPSDLLEINHIRLSSTTSNDAFVGQGSVTIQRADKTSFEELRQYLNSTRFTQNTFNQFDFPLYWMDNQRIYFAPDFNANDVIEMTYYQEVPEMGSTVNRVNANYEAINDSDETLAQWVAAGNSAGTFVQATQVVTANLWSATIPQVLKASACREAETFLSNPTRAQVWDEQFKELLISTEREFRRLDSAGPQAITQNTVY